MVLRPGRSAPVIRLAFQGLAEAEAAQWRRRLQGLRPDLVVTDPSRADWLLSRGGDSLILSGPGGWRLVSSPEDAAALWPESGSGLRSPVASAGALSPREEDLLRHLAAGLDNKGLAGALGISANTVKFHLAALYRKLGAHHRTEALKKALDRGWLTL